MKYLMWLLKAAIFFTLFAFALNNQQTVAVHFFFGTLWQAPLVLVVLATFACGLALGVFVMMPRWWKKHKTAQRHHSGSSTFGTTTTAADNPSSLHHGI
ncbi:lipopolysaccharide assembly LapA domain-containing protein [Polaromonas sp. OV174]|uniref:LapA family protein n=1 Tax=Polaromonas sp. OV174 TaxID=1855300 RepID=UPI000B160AAA|nr:LapA family protein [Polaromonas sp. OV174]